MNRCKVFLVLSLIFLPACTNLSPTEGAQTSLEPTVQVHATWLSYLSTQISAPGLSGTVAALSTQNSVLQTAVASGHQRPSFTETPEPSSFLFYPREARTGIDEIDQVIEAFLEQDMDRLLALVRLTQTGCTHADGLGGPPKCQPNQAEGNQVGVFPLSGPEGHFAQADQMARVLEISAEGLFAVYKVPEDAFQAEYWPAGEYGIVFITKDIAPIAVTLLVEEGRIVRLNYEFSPTPYDIPGIVGGRLVLPPLTKEIMR